MGAAQPWKQYCKNQLNKAKASIITGKHHYAFIVYISNIIMKQNYGKKTTKLKWPHATWEFYLTEKKDIKKLSNEKFLAKFLETLPKSIRLHTIGKPLIHNFPEKNGVMAEGGITGFVLLTESDITIHTWPEYAYGCIDIFACENFSVKAAEKMIRKTFGKGNYSRDLVYRGEIIPAEKSRK